MGSLCDICRTIPFREIQENPDLKIKRVKLGDYDDVNQRVSCPFCCLALQSIRDVANRLGYSDTAEYLRKDCFGTSIEVQWRQQDRAFETGAFPLRYTTGSFPSLARVVHSEPVSIDPIISCLEDCEKGHQCSLSISDEDVEKLPFLRAIDVRQMCVAYIPPSTRYVALSYIWGGAPALYLQRANIREFMRPGGLKTYDDEIPATIRDAIELVRKMNLEYLWVDALCLVQDDNEDMTIGINAMSIIYEHSYFTIVAAGGITAHSGLAGVSPRNVSQVKGEIVPGVSLIEIYPIGDLLEIAHYNRRAWTFQEFHLSRRKVIFHNNMLYYQCMKGSWSEDIQGVPIESRIRYRALAPTRPGQMLYEFRLIIKDYTIRDATYQHDIVNAMVSIYHKLLGREYGGHLFAVPVVAFDAFLCFYNKDDHHKFLERRESLPSWTWSGWRGDFYWACSSDDNETLLWIADSTWIVWYLRDSYGDLKLVWELAQGQHSSSATSTEKLRISRAAGAQRFSADCLPTLPLRSVPHDFKHRRGLLQFWTISASFSLRVDAAGEKYLQSLGFLDWKVAQQVFGPDDKYFGFVQVDEESWKRDHDVVELIAISEASEIISYDHGAFYRNKNWKNLTRDGSGCWYNVLYVDNTSGIAERKGFGQIRCGPIQLSPSSHWRWKEIILG